MREIRHEHGRVLDRGEREKDGDGGILASGVM